LDKNAVFDKLNARTPIYPVVIFRQLVHGEGTDKLITGATENQPDGFRLQPYSTPLNKRAYPEIPAMLSAGQVSTQVE
jgi:hypothetical protein